MITSSFAFAANGELGGFPGNLKGCFSNDDVSPHCYCNSAGNAPYSQNGATPCTSCGPGSKCTYGSVQGGLKPILKAIKSIR